MAEIFQLGPVSYTVNAAVTAGQLVMPDSTTGKVKPATAGAVTVLGVARDSGAPAGSGTATDFGTLRPEIAVYSAPYEVKVTFAADTLFGQKVIAGASGQVTPIVDPAATGTATATTAGDITATRGVVGYCTEPGGVLATGTGRIKLV